MNTQTMNKVTYGDYGFDPAVVPAVSIAALLSRGFSHYLGNEQASKVVSKIEKVLAGDTAETKAAFGKLSKDERKAAISTYRKENAASVAAWEKEVRDEAMADLLSGEIGTSNRGPKVDPVTAAMQAIAKREIGDILKGAGLKYPKAGESVVLGADTILAEQLVPRRLAKHGDRIKKEAEKHVADLARKAKQAADKAAKAKADGVANAEALDL